METAIEKACRLADGQSGLAGLLKVSPQAVHKWVKKGRVPPSKAPIVELVLNGQVKSEELCPNFPWPKRKSKRQ